MIMLRYIFFAICFVLKLIGNECVKPNEVPDVCSKCEDRTSSSEVVGFCQKSNSSGHLIVDKACCLNYSSEETFTVLGLDFSHCNISSITGVINVYPDLHILMLENNTNLQVSDQDFRGLSKLVYLSLPLTMNCPGGNNSWRISEISNNAMLCREEIDLCIQNNVTCESQNSSICVLVGPGEVECLCQAGYYGYKCLRQGTFPTVVFSISLCIIVVMLSALLWLAQRRKIKPKTY
ncbi:all-trans retinoic acid-induced differentiation factor-like [Dreissena polymorpha]|uniref:EGF-like domain-containing protein n=1 Tax=Dreissena polymorpha TaxID=45954 RepID=A0A9D3YBS3_DREPO|nr:all-trans retinoic acid-induced differentiation factor-like [Dreissena polymorpha]KAH3695434.1 hypothetical protein DPMN_082893 [Dreissena polymorpha]